MAAMPPESFQYIVNHVILPPKLPQGAEDAKDPQLSRTAERHLVKLVSLQLESYCSRIDRGSSSVCAAWAINQAMLDRCASLFSTPSLDAGTIVRAFASLDETDIPSVLPIHIRAQNAVLILRKGEDSVVFECFEASPLAEAVMACKGALTRCFPAHAVSIPVEVFDDENFQRELADKICRLDVEHVEEMMPNSQKAGRSNVEIRDTTDPSLVTEMLMAILASLGTPVNVQQIQKRTRDDVLWDNSLLPWRRSPFWLALRVTIQSTLAGTLPINEATAEYKNFMIFFLTEIASQASTSNLPDEMCHVILAKIARRAAKLGSDTHDFVQDRALRICRVLDNEQKRKWKLICDEDGNRPTTIDRGVFERDTALSLVTSKPYINTVLKNDQDMLHSQNSFEPKCQPWLEFNRGLPTLNMATAAQEENLYVLAEFEAWVSTSLPYWTQQRLIKPDTKDCMTLANLATRYRDAASPMYEGAPEQLSSMLLVIAELWHSLDQLTMSLLPLLKDFSPSIPSDLFNPLLLPKMTQMRRLWEVELHIGARQTQAKGINPSIFSDPADKCFAVQFFASSGRHWALKKRIEDEASAKREWKEAEWRESSDKYHRLKQKAKLMTCQMTPHESGEERHDAVTCEKCILIREADTMTIDVHEWPLPDNASSCKSAVVELDCPAEFAAWRNLTWMLIQDLGRQASIGGENPAARLCSYVGLQGYAKDKKSRLTLASSTKPFAQAHYHLLRFPVPLDSCYAKNALQYKLFDSLGGCWIGDQTESPSFQATCVTPLPEGPYSNMQYAVDSVSHSQNEVIANQESCSRVLSLHEYLSFGSLRADGERIQWHNIKREMAAPNLSLNTEAVCTLVTQAACQAGSRGCSHLRNTHLDLQNPSFCVELLATISKVLESILANWKSDHVMLLLITVVRRILSLSSDTNVVSVSLDLLEKMRSVARHWTMVLAATLAKCAEPDQISKLQQRLLKAAILCKMTFDVDTQYLSRVMDTADDLSTWVQCSIHVRNNSPGEETLLSRDLRRLRLRDTKFSHAFHGTIRQLAINNICQGLDLAIAQQWTGFHPGSGSWRAFDYPNDRWLITETATTARQRPQQVCYNLLEGELLVDGKPLGRLPAHYIRNDIYLRVFGAQILRVFLSDMQGMLYMSATEIDGYCVHFGMRQGQMVVRMRKGLQILELLPHHVFVDDLPTVFVTGYVHWLDVVSQEIELRPLAQRWRSDVEHWRIRYQLKGTSNLLLRDRKLIDIRSKTCYSIMNIFGSLEVVEHVHVTFSNDQRLEVALPRYDLRFFLNHNGEFQCYELGKIVDPDQSVGTLIGLKSRLVLSGILPLARKHDRVVLIPEGQVSLARKGSHVEATITVLGPEIRLVRYHIDATLGQLKGDGDMFSIIYKAYLHAITSNMLPDPFTECTGTEEAISLLRQRSLGLIKPPDERTVDVLKNVATLTPRREFYPDHLKIMQQVRWHKTLSMLTQHDDFLPLADDIITSGDLYLVFHPEARPADSLCKRRNPHLLQRAQIRNSCFRSSKFGGEIKVRDHDSKYKARDWVAETARGTRSFEIASLVQDWPNELEVSGNLKKDLHSIGIVSGFGTPFDAAKLISELLDVRFSDSWAPLHYVCRTSSQDDDTYHLLFLFAIIAYGKRMLSLTTLRTLLAFAFIPKLRKISISAHFPYFEPRKGSIWDEDALRDVILSHMKSYNGSGKRRDRARWNTENERYDAQSKEQTKNILVEYKRQWPCKTPKTPSESLSSHLDWETASQTISDLFYIWTANGKLRKYLGLVQPILNYIYLESSFSEYTATNWHLVQEPQPTHESRPLPSLSSLMLGLAPASLSKPDVLKIVRPLKSTQKNERLRALIAAIRSDSEGNNHHLLRRHYRDDLLASYDTFSNYKEQVNPQRLPHQLTDTVFNRLTCESEVSGILKVIQDVLGARSPVSRLLELAGLWPRLTLRSLLVNLSTRSSKPLTQPWKRCFLALGESVTLLQRARRLVLTGERNDISTFCVEIENEGHKSWDMDQWPDWLLIEIEGDFLIRPTQARVALEMIQPSSSANSLVQLNMGEGKSSVIVPLVAVAIADGKRLSRIIVLKSLAKQMSDTVSQRLGGMVDRRIYFMPFSRKVQVNEGVVAHIQNLHQSCLDSGGILLAQPEHILSFKLMGIERLTSGDLEIASELIKSQRWLQSNARDILDESDELLDVKFQLIYTLGTQRMMDGQPDRWLIVQGIFDLVQKNASNLQEENPGQVEIVCRSKSSFPMITLLSKEINQELIARIASDVVDSHLPGLNFQFCPPAVTNAVLNFIQDRQVSAEDCQEVTRSFGEQKSFIQKLLLVRGFIAYKILIFVLRSKRWSVNYGLDPTRCMSAVPYRAKGVPAPSAEFGHPDVAVALTCLSYYYNGLSDHQIRKSLELLQKSDDPSVEYLSWIKRCDQLPIHLRSWYAVNLEDDHQCYNELFPELRYSKKLVDFFMSHVVFPKEGKEFDEKLSTSGWDLVSNQPPHLTTGFSGTNDNRFVLPLSISQGDLPELQHTSGKVLDYVLRKENLLYHCARDDLGRQLSAEGLVSYFHGLDSTIRVLIDVGAQVLDTTNRDFVKVWMEAASDVDAGIFFDEDDNAMVLTRDLKLEKLAVSSFQNRMDRCVVYLDEVHTRGTDLKLPATVRAAVTLGPRLTKDRLVQACMRLRKLAQGQTLMFLAPPEVHQSITEVTGKPDGQLDGYDVVVWSLEQSCQSIERSQPLRILQGLNHSQRQAIMDKFSTTFPSLDKIAKEEDSSSELITGFREKEEQRLHDLYAPVSLKDNVLPGVIESSQKMSDPMSQTLLEMWRALDSAGSEDASVHEEHEREVAHEVEQETQIERPPKVKALPRAVDPALHDLITTGRLENFMKFPIVYDRVVKMASAKLDDNIDPWPHLRVTEDFARTVERPQSGFYDSYLRPVNFVLTCKREVKPGFLLIISQYEANELLREIQDAASGVRFQVYEPRVMKSMTAVDIGTEPVSRSVDDWQSLGSGIRRQLHLFAGQVYLNSYKDYQKLSTDLGPRLNPSIEQTRSFIKAWIAIRRKGQDFLQSHIGQMVSGRAIMEEAFE